MFSNVSKAFSSCIQYLDSDYFPEGSAKIMALPKRVELDRCIPFILLHLACLGIFFVGYSSFALATCLFLYFARIFVVTAFYHRYFSHRAFSASRPVQFLFALIATTSAQRGPLWWAANHRKHHRDSDQADDIHSPVQKGFLWSHIGWITSSANMPTDYSIIPDLAKYPELVFLNRFDWLPPLSLALILLATGEFLKVHAPFLGTSGWQLVFWGFFLSTVMLFHITCCINSLTHIYGSQRYDTGDNSRNNFALALLTFGEGWHNNHHKFPGTVRQGFFWWEIDITYAILKVLAFFRIVSNLRPVPAAAYTIVSNKLEKTRNRDELVKVK